MSTKEKEAGAAEATATPLTPEEIMARLIALRDGIAVPDLAPAPAGLRRRLGHVHPDFVNAAINAVGVSDAVQTALGRSDEDLRQELDTIARLTACMDVARSVEKTIAAAITVLRQRLGLQTLQTYQISRQLVRDERHAVRLNAHVAEMRRLNRFGRRRAKPPQPDDEVQTKTK